MKKYIAVALLFALAFMAGCTKDDQVIKGEVIEVNSDSNAIIVESVSDDMSGIVWIRLENARYKTRVSKDFYVGNYVEISINSAVTRSYPPQANATKVFVNNE